MVTIDTLKAPIISYKNGGFGNYGSRYKSKWIWEY